jgi:hypothetical protein
MKRPTIPYRVMVNVAISQAEHGTIRCPICHTGLAAMDDRILEHMVPHELGGASDETNLRWVHKECAAKKTNGRKPTVADGDIHKIAKAKRLQRAHEAHEAVVLGTAEKPPGTIKSRGFQGSRKFDGTPVWRTK